MHLENLHKVWCCLDANSPHEIRELEDASGSGLREGPFMRPPTGSMSQRIPLISVSKQKQPVQVNNNSEIDFATFPAKLKALRLPDEDAIAELGCLRAVGREWATLNTLMGKMPSGLTEDRVISRSRVKAAVVRGHVENMTNICKAPTPASSSTRIVHEKLYLLNFSLVADDVNELLLD